MNFIFVDPPGDPQFDNRFNSFILSKRRQLRSKSARNQTIPDSLFPFKQAECVHTCLADDYRFVERHAKHPAAELPGEGAFTVPMFDVLLANANTDAIASVPELPRRAALDIGPLTLPNLLSPSDKVEAAVTQLRTTIQNFLNLRLRSTFTPFANAAAVARFGVQAQQFINGAPVGIQAYGALCGL